MLPSEIAKLLTYAQVLDRRMGDVDDFKVYAWLDVLHPDMTFEDGRKFVAKHYSNSGEMLRPNVLNEAFRNQRNSQAQRVELPTPKPADPEVAAKYLAEMREAIRTSFVMDTHGEAVRSERIDAPSEPSTGVYSDFVAKNVSEQGSEVLNTPK